MTVAVQGAGVGRQPFAETAQQLRHRHALVFAGQIPEGDVQRADADLADVFRRAAHLQIQLLAGQCRLTQQSVGQRLTGRHDDFGATARRHVLAAKTVTGVDLDRQTQLRRATAGLIMNT